MLSNHRVKLNELDEGFIRKLKKAHHSEDAVVYFQVLPGQTGDVLTNTQFWELIDKLDWSKENESNELVVKPLTEHLASLSPSHIYQFQEILSKKLFELDTKAHAMNCGENSWRGEDQPFSVDEFLYARACVVANGSQRFEEVLSDPQKMLKDLTFEALLYVAPDAYKKKTGNRFDYLPSNSFETFSNKEGWNT